MSIFAPQASHTADRRVFCLADLHEQVGQELAISPWLAIEQARIDAFADCTEDHQWIHLDSARATKESPFGNTIAHGYLTLALIPTLAERSYCLEGFRSKLNYGLNRARFIQPVVSGSRIRGRFLLQDLQAQAEGRYQLTMQVTLEIQGSDKPACIAETVALLLP